MEALGKLTTVIFIIILSILLSGLMIHCFYHWFLIQVFTLSSINFSQSIGLGFVLSLFHVIKKDKEEKQIEDLVKEFFSSAFTKLIVLGIAYLVYVILF